MGDRGAIFDIIHTLAQQIWPFRGYIVYSSPAWDCLAAVALSRSASVKPRQPLSLPKRERSKMCKTLRHFPGHHSLTHSLSLSCIRRMQVSYETLRGPSRAVELYTWRLKCRDYIFHSSPHMRRGGEEVLWNPRDLCTVSKW